MTEARYHRCHKCSMIILCDVYFIKNHLHRHKMDLQQYVERFNIEAFVLGLNVSGRKKLPSHWAKEYYDRESENSETKKDDKLKMFPRVLLRKIVLKYR